MKKMLFLPDSEQAGKMIDNAWQEFLQQAKDAGYDITDCDGFLHDCFVSGYCFGWNDILGIIRDQLNVEYVAHEIMKS